MARGSKSTAISGHGNNLFGEVLNVPLFIHPPGGLAEARRIAESVSHLDVLPTLRELAGLPAAAKPRVFPSCPFFAARR